MKARSRPIGALLTAELGVSKTLWGDENDQWKYGYMRSAVRLETIGVVHRGAVELQLYPISIFGLSLGAQGSYRTFAQSFIDCQSIACRGFLGKLFLENQIILGKGPVFFWSRMRYSHVKHPHDTIKFIDEIGPIIGNAGGDHLLEFHEILGVKLSPQWSTGLYYMHQKMLQNSTYTQHIVGFGQYRWEKWNFLLGTGTYRSSLLPMGLTFISQITYRIHNSVALLSR
ncbi:MAG: hypothetical protein CL678_11325 [Bdellovibrionaceae bacterium]|nr:hypothetical protein [Pseudobdellovibrionaceae bacterium]|tara:strand:+ start:2791 stop:3474 length:684 start_codon:yes stop_codon:yes gene_type:complete